MEYGGEGTYKKYVNPYMMTDKAKGEYRVELL
jgi:hypothetical protein